MNARTATNLSEAQQIERALELLVTTALASKAPWPRRFEGARSVGAILQDYLASTPAQQAANALIDDPVGESLRQSVSTLGMRLHEIGGMKLMGEVLDRVVSTDPATECHREGLIDHRWSGIGEWMG